MASQKNVAPLPKGASIYFMGIAGTGMGTVAGLFKEAGYHVLGSDAGVYPPMSNLLNDLNIEVKTPYHPSNLSQLEKSPDLVVVANCLSRGHEELESLLASEIPYTSFPKLLGDEFLANQESIVVTGTHGKTTTSSLLTHVLKELGHDPGYVIGGVPKSFGKSFHVGAGNLFVTEGDEYDTAFFDKESKFLHYYPKTLLINNLEFDHADIFNSLEDIKRMFAKLIDKVKDKKSIICNWDDDNVRGLILSKGLENQVTKISLSYLGISRDQKAVHSVEAANLEKVNVNTPLMWTMNLKTVTWGEQILKTPMSGHHNMYNACMALAAISNLIERNVIEKPDFTMVQDAFLKFENVKRRLDHLGSRNGIDVYEDFAHHPTAVAHIIETFRHSAPNKRIVACFEPKNATARRNIFEDDYAEKLAGADLVLIGASPVDLRIPEENRMNTNNICKKIGSHAKNFSTNEELLDWASANLKKDDVVIFMSSGSFSGIQHKLLEALGEQ